MKTLASENRLRFFDKEQKAIPNLLVFVELQSNHKNNYVLGPLKTDESGTILLTVEMIKSKIHSSIEEYPSDYSDRLEDLKEEVLVRIECERDFKDRIDRLEKFYPESAKRLKNSLRGSSNEVLPQTLEWKQALEEQIDIIV